MPKLDLQVQIPQALHDLQATMAQVTWLTESQLRDYQQMEEQIKQMAQAGQQLWNDPDALAKTFHHLCSQVEQLRKHSHLLHGAMQGASSWSQTQAAWINKWRMADQADQAVQLHPKAQVN